MTEAAEMKSIVEIKPGDEVIVWGNKRVYVKSIQHASSVFVDMSYPFLAQSRIFEYTDKKEKCDEPNKIRMGRSLRDMDSTVSSPSIWTLDSMIEIPKQ